MAIFTNGTDGVSLQLTEELADIADRLRQSTVQVRGSRTGAGSGVIWQSNDAASVIVSNAHVVRGTSAEVELWDGRIFPATVMGKNLQRDLVALQVAAANLPRATIGNSAALRTGEVVLAVGNPLGLTGALTTGIIHTLGPAGASYGNWIQADIQLAPGNSGGPLANARGDVIGINTMIVNGRGFAIPSRVVDRVLQSMQHPQSENDRPYLGITVRAIGVALQGRLAFGLQIQAVEADSPAGMAQLQAGDVLIGVRGQRFQTPDQLFQILQSSNVGDELSLNLLRNGQQRVARVLCSKFPQTKAA